MKLIQKIRSWLNSAPDKPRVNMEYWLDIKDDETIIERLKPILRAHDLNIISASPFQTTAYGRDYYISCQTAFGLRGEQDYLLLWVVGSHVYQQAISDLMSDIESAIDFKGKVDHRFDNYPWDDLHRLAERSLIK